MIGKYLKHYRTVEREITLDVVQEKTGIAKGYLSRIENNKTDPNNDYLVDVLIKGYDLRPSEAKDMASEWRITESLSQADDPEKVLKNVSESVIGSGNIVKGHIIKGNIIGSHNTINR